MHIYIYDVHGHVMMLCTWTCFLFVCLCTQSCVTTFPSVSVKKWDTCVKTPILPDTPAIWWVCIGFMAKSDFYGWTVRFWICSINFSDKHTPFNNHLLFSCRNGTTAKGRRRLRGDHCDTKSKRFLMENPWNGGIHSQSFIGIYWG